ncbi:hypothetical protein [Streptomyces sp. NPDC049879]|uniref:hypothetical protein n=1 Tax=Streptomyces sp. NPDC049879 TaxID=3365598 RepID=UPI0037AD45C1
MAWAVLYIAFGVVALWLLGEVLLQYKARLRWRLLAFCGFLLVVIGVMIPSVPVIALGTVAFASGQTFVTLSFRRGFSTGWALGGKPGTSRRRRAVQALAPVPDGEAGDGGDDDAMTPPARPDDTPVDGVPQAHDDTQAARGGQDTHDGYDAYDNLDSTQVHARVPSGDDEHAHAAPGEEIYAATADMPYGDPYLGGYAPEPAAYGEAPSTVYAVHDTGENYAAYQDPYLDATSGYQQGGGQPYTGGYPGHGGYGDDGGPSSGQWPAAGQYHQETPPGGVWVPQQRDTAQEQGANGYGYPPAQQDGYPSGDPYDPSGQAYYPPYPEYSEYPGYSDNDQQRY